MIKTEHERIQAELDKLINCSLYIKYGYIGVKAEGFRRGIMEAKNVVREVYEKRGNHK